MEEVDRDKDVVDDDSMLPAAAAFEFLTFPAISIKGSSESEDSSNFFAVVAAPVLLLAVLFLSRLSDDFLLLSLALALAPLTGVDAEEELTALLPLLLPLRARLASLSFALAVLLSDSKRLRLLLLD